MNSLAFDLHGVARLAGAPVHCPRRLTNGGHMRFGFQLFARSGFFALLITQAVAVHGWSNTDEMLYDQWRQQQERDQARSEAEQAELQRQIEADERHYADLKTRLKRCGRCPERTELEAEIRQIEANRRTALIIWCAAVDQFSSMPNFDAVNKMMGLGKQCRAAGLDPRSLKEAERKTTLQTLERKAASGKPEDLYAVGAFHINAAYSRYDLAAPWLFRAARQDYLPAVTLYLAQCVSHDTQETVASQRADLVGFVTRCAQRGELQCLGALGAMHSSSYARGERIRYFEADDRKSLAYLEQAASAAPDSNWIAAAIDRQKIHMGLKEKPADPTKSGRAEECRWMEQNRHLMAGASPASKAQFDAAFAKKCGR